MYAMGCTPKIINPKMLIIKEKIKQKKKKLVNTVI